ncbi:MAG: mannonate dehydratase, partial [Duncaniella sp.]|nr:mannonate dehydratase [Duncaniella sp.]
MEKTWRWFGPNDKITLEMLRQIGVEGIVTSLHHIPNGEVWSLGEVEKMKNYIEARGLRWSVVESLPVSESIKYGGPDRDQLIERYKESLANLGKAGVKTVCYNFMPVLDWARTDLEYPNADGTSNLYFNRAEFAYFDIHILNRPGAEADYDAETLRRMKTEVLPRMDAEAEHRLVANIIVKTQGFVNGNISE